jgi:hypothetical protein
LSNLDELSCDWSRKGRRRRPNPAAGESKWESPRHEAFSRQGVWMARLQCTLILYLHGRTSIMDELRYHVNHLHQFIIYIPHRISMSSPSSPLCQPNVSPLPIPSQHSQATLLQHPPLLSFKHLYVNKNSKPQLVVPGFPSAISSSISDVLWGETERLNPALTSELNSHTPRDPAAATYVRF